MAKLVVPAVIVNKINRKKKKYLYKILNLFNNNNSNKKNQLVMKK